MAAEAAEASARLCEHAGFRLLSRGLPPATHGPQRTCVCARVRTRVPTCGLGASLETLGGLAMAGYHFLRGNQQLEPDSQLSC